MCLIILLAKKIIMLFEREFSEKSAHLFWEECIQALNLTYKLEHIGKNIVTTVCNLIPEKELPNQLINSLIGIGKGRSFAQSNLSAKYEAIQHYLETIYNNKEIVLYYYTLEEVKLNNIFILPGEPEEDFYESILPDKKIAWLKMRSLLHYNSVIHFPIACFDPYSVYLSPDEVDYKDKYFLSNDNGCAIGCSQNEALIHGISEIIERDSISLFLIKVFLCKQKIKILNIKSLPTHLQELCAQVEFEIQSEIVIVDLESSFKIQAFAVFAKNPGSDTPYKGYGASLSHDYAIERALLECVQYYHLCNKYHWNEEASDLFVDIEDENYLQAAKLNIFNLLEKKFFDVIDYQCQESVIHLSSKNYLNEILLDIKENGFDVFFTQLYPFNNSVSLVKCFMPEIENFYAICYGYIPLIKKRGKKLIELYS